MVEYSQKEISSSLAESVKVRRNVSAEMKMRHFLQGFWLLSSGCNAPSEIPWSVPHSVHHPPLLGAGQTEWQKCSWDHFLTVPLRKMSSLKGEKCTESSHIDPSKVNPPLQGPMLVRSRFRSGSTFLLSLMTAGDNIAQFGEPLAKFQHQGNNLQKIR